MADEEKKAPELRFKGFLDDWEQRKFEEMLDKNDGVRRGPFGSSLKKEIFVENSDYVVYEQQNAIYDNYKTRYNISKEKFDELHKFSLKENDFIMSGAGTIGRISRVPKGIKPGVFNQALIRFRINSELTSPEYFLQFIRAENMQRKLTGANPGSAITNLVPMTEVKNWDIFVPAKAEQSKLGAFFNQLDNTIALHQQKQRQIRSLKQGFIKNLFPNNKNSAPRIRFSIFNDDWNQRNASEIFTSVSDKNYPELPVLSASQEKGMVLRESNGIDIKYDQKSTGTYKRVLPGQFVMHLRSFQGGFAYSTIEGITSPAYTILAFRNKEDHYPLFWKSIFSSKNFIKRLEAITYGIRDGRSISYADFSTLRFWIPSYEEQKQIGDFIESIDATIAFYQRQIDMMQSLKKELLNKMFI